MLVCSRYDLGAIHALHRLRGGSRESPKVIVVSDRGRYLIKRRAPARSGREGGPASEDVAHRVALSHQVQLHLAAHGFPVARLMGTREGNNSLLELNGSIYEVFEFVEGRRYGHTAGEAMGAGRLLGTAHRLLADLHPAWTPAEVTYHNHPAVARSIDELAVRIDNVRVREDLGVIRDAYVRASAMGERLGVSSHPPQLIHGDWHPGNLLYADADGAGPVVVAVLDFDAVRLGQPVVDLANGALQFAAVRRTVPSSEGGATGIRLSLNPELIRSFCAGYWSSNPLSRLHVKDVSVIPPLMVEAIVVETIAPIAATGRFGKVSAAAALAMTRQAVEWLALETPRLVSLATGL